MSGFSFSKLKQAKPSMRRRLFLYMGALAAKRSSKVRFYGELCNHR